MNRKYAQIWPNLTRKKDALPEADQYRGETNKFDQYFSPNPGEGNW
ncbi:DUF3470 domain-containing protein [Planktothrix mougeotii]|uniref:DUF3470 domain-containing protein n=1 Tax=Planktothrix mougeotii LEGE 06226 TaxID=1828728 RepID=A0ABR9UFT5_9CYAN|nr:DUF3470 domain-containing protein [Planktothrix mougeotii LEGE 06226]